MLHCEFGLLFAFTWQKAKLMNLLFVAMLVLLSLLLWLSLLHGKRLSEFSPEHIDLAPILNRLETIQENQEQSDRSIRDEMSRNRLEQANLSQALRGDMMAAITGIGNSVSLKAEALTRSNDQKLELVRSAMEQRLDSFTAESGRRSDSLAQSTLLSSGKLQDEVSARLEQFKVLLHGTVKEAHELQREQTATVASAIQAISEQTSHKLSDVESALRSQAQLLREETGTTVKGLGDSIVATLTGISQVQKTELHELRFTVDSRLVTIQNENEKKLEQMRQTVDEKLHGTLEARLGDSFKQVSDRLEQVYRGLGEMQTLAAGVGDLKRVLTNVKTRGTWGEIQLGALLEQMLAPDQYEQNVTTSGTSERVEYAIKLPGHDGNGAPVWLPIDAKFPIEDYQRLIEASERGDVEAIEKASRQLETTLKGCAKTLHDKYIAPPATTEFGILFLSTEGLYAEAMRRTGLGEFIQREYRIVLAGPSTLAAMLNSFQMGFRTLAIQKRSSEVWDLLGIVKSEFEKYAGVLAKLKRKLNEAQNTIDNAETRTRAIQRKLRSVEASDNLHVLEAGTSENDPTELDAQVLTAAVAED